MDKSRVDVRVHDGKLIGIVDENVYGKKYIAFRGIPYAKPPVGELRFKDPVPAEPWTGDRDASEFGNVSVQKDMITHKIIGDEDCLYLNVYSQVQTILVTDDFANIKPPKKRSVMVWIHGGGYYLGAGDALFYGPDHIVQKDVVLVTLNYRLGIFGFLNLEDKVATGNQGLKDVILALRWVQQNIAVFGGDPDNVTIFGESAGSAIVHFLALSPLAAGLFHKAIAESGVVSNYWSFNEWTSKAENSGYQIVEKLGKKTRDPKVAYDFLKTIDAKQLIQFVQIEDEQSNLSHRQIKLKFAVSLDRESPNPVLPEHPEKLLQRGVKVPFLLGCNKCEGSFILQGKFFGDINKDSLKEIDADFSEAIVSKVLKKLPVTVDELRSYYFGKKPISEETLSSYANFIGDIMFYQGIMEAAIIQTKPNVTSEPTYLYYFTYDSDTSFMKHILNVKIPGACHTAELGFLFYPHVTKELGLSPPMPGSEDYKMINRMVQMWTDFAKTGNPTPTITELTPVKWTPLKPGDLLDCLNIDVKPQMMTFRKGKERWNWENIRNKQ